MDKQKKSQVNEKQSREALHAAKERLSEQAHQLSLKEYMVAHPYITLSAAFFTGIIAGGSRDMLEDVAHVVVSAVSKEFTGKSGGTDVG